MSIQELEIFLNRQLVNYNFHLRMLGGYNDTWIENYHKKMVKRYKKEITELCNYHRIANPLG